MLRKILFISLVFAFLSCSENSNDTENSPTVQIVSSINSDYYPASGVIQNEIADEHVDSIKISEMNVLISRIILHHNDEDISLNEKAGPFIVKANYDSNYYEIVTTDVPEGEYNQIKLEMHRFSASETSDWVNDEDFGVFATSERYSVVIKGTIYNGTEAEDFTYQGTVTANLSLDFDDYYDLTEDDLLMINIEFDPESLFYDKGTFLDPRNDGNNNKIDNNIKSAFRAIPELY